MFRLGFLCGLAITGAATAAFPADLLDSGEATTHKASPPTELGYSAEPGSPETPADSLCRHIAPWPKYLLTTTRWESLPPPQDDMVLGRLDAPVEVIEYTSITSMACSCANHFDRVVLPQIEAKYIQTGKVRFRVRLYTNNYADALAGQLVGCVPAQGRHALLEPLEKRFAERKIFYGKATQKSCVRTYNDMQSYASKLGLSADQFAICMADTSRMEWQESMMKQGWSETFKNFPGLIINGTAYTFSTLEEFDRVVKPLLEPKD